MLFAIRCSGAIVAIIGKWPGKRSNAVAPPHRVGLGGQAAARRNQIPRGILYMVASTVVFAGVNAVVKWELALYPVGEVAFFRSLFAFAAVALMILPRRGWGVLRT